jgi:hypothetical protein
MNLKNLCSFDFGFSFSYQIHQNEPSSLTMHPPNTQEGVLLRVKRPREEEPVSLFLVDSTSKSSSGSNKKQKTFRLVASVTSSSLATSSRPIASPSTSRQETLADKKMVFDDCSYDLERE